jgi:dipeptidyl-peptidase-4
MTSDKDGYNHIYQHRMDGTVYRKITSGNWDVTDFYGVNEAKKLVYYQSAENSPLERNVYVTDAKGKKTCISPAKGTNEAYFSKTFSYFLLAETAVDTPDKFSVCLSSGQKLRTVETNAELLESCRDLLKAKKEFMKIKTSDGTELNAWMLKPVNFDAATRYPLIMVQYSGPGSQEVLNKWGIGWEYYLITKGFIVVCVDGRGTGGRGSEFLKCTYKQMGIPEAKDQTAAAGYLGSLPYIDKNRIGIWGWSYGGSTTLWAMSTGEAVFKAGIAVAPVTDWRFYDSAFTERFMSTPEENFEGYEKTSALLQAKNLHGRLLLIHGTADDNVHYQNSLLYADKLVEAGIQFEMQVYTDKNHSILGKSARKHLYRRMAEFFERNL